MAVHYNSIIFCFVFILTFTLVAYMIKPDSSHIQVFAETDMI